MDVDGGGTVLKDVIVECRKPHKCIECGAKIQPREICKKEQNYEDGIFYSYRTCMSCFSLRHVFFCDGWYYGQIWDDFEGFVSSCYGDISISAIGKLHPVARARVCEILERYWEVMG
jgi:hypothetical protein